MFFRRQVRWSDIPISLRIFIKLFIKCLQGAVQASQVAQWQRISLQCRRLGFHPRVKKIPGEGNGNPLQYSYLGNPMYRGAWWAAVHGITKESYMTQWLKCDNSNFAFLSQIFSDLETSMHLVGRGCLLWPVLSLGRTLLAFALLQSILQGQICLLLRVFLDFLLLHSSPL